MAIILSAENISTSSWIEINKRARTEFNSYPDPIYYWFKMHYSARELYGKDGEYIRFKFQSKEDYVRFTLTWM